MHYQTSSAVLFIIFNRPQPTARVFESIRAAKPPRLYVAADGPRTTKTGEAELCKQAREIATQVDWPCELKTFFKDKNTGCKEGEASAMTWFFENEEEGIILEDDTLPDNSFFRFCDTLLDKYRTDTRVRIIAGVNLQQGKKWGDASYYFSTIIHGWGWAGWRRIWNEYDKNLTQYDIKDVKEKLGNVFDNPLVIDSWFDLFKRTQAGKIDTWDYQFAFSSFFNNGLCIIPNNNLITNIGFGDGATHTVNSDSLYSNIPLEPMDEIKHPLYVIPEKKADWNVLNYVFDIDKQIKKHQSPGQRIKRLFKRSTK